MSETKITTGLVRLSYARVWAPEADQKGDKFYSTCVMIPKRDKAGLKKIEAAIEAAIADKWGSKRPKGLKLPLRDGDEEKDGEEFKGMMFFNCKSKRKPLVLDAKRDEVLDEGEVYSGVWGKINVGFYAFEGDSKGIAAGFNAFQKLKDDTELSGGGATADDFEDEEEDEI